MATKLTIRYDKAGDILYIDKCPPYAEQESELLANEIAVRLNPSTEEVETIEVLSLMKRLKAGECIEIPVQGTWRLTVNA